MATFVLTFDDIVLSSAERPLSALQRGFFWSRGGLHPTNDNSGLETHSGPNAGRFDLSGDWAAGAYSDAAPLSSLSLNGNFDLRSSGFFPARIANFIVTVRAQGHGVLVGTKLVTFANDGAPVWRDGSAAGNVFEAFGRGAGLESDHFAFDGQGPQDDPADNRVESRAVPSAPTDFDRPSDGDDDGAGENVKYMLAVLPAFGILLLDGRLIGPKGHVAQTESGGDLRASVAHSSFALDRFSPAVPEARGDTFASRHKAVDSLIGFTAGIVPAGTSGTDGAHALDSGDHAGVIVGGVTLKLGHNEIAADGITTLVVGGPSAEAIKTHDADDVVLGSAGDDEIDAGDGNNVVDGGPGDDKIVTGKGNDHVRGGGGNDDIKAGDGDNVVDGGAGDDIIRTGSGRDLISGGAGNDTIHAGAGNDTILLGVKSPHGDGHDTIFGGPGADLFVIAGHFGLDAIKDFGTDDRLIAVDPVEQSGTVDQAAGSGTPVPVASDAIGTVPENAQPIEQAAIEETAAVDAPEESVFLSEDADWASLNGGFIITERYNDDLLLTFNFGGDEASMLTLNDFFAYNSGPGFGADTPDGILDDADAVPILLAIFKDGSASAQDYDFLM